MNIDWRLSKNHAVVLLVSWDLTLVRNCFSEKMLGPEGGWLWVHLLPAVAV